MEEDNRWMRAGYIALYLLSGIWIVLALVGIWRSGSEVWRWLVFLLAGCVLCYLAGLWHGSVAGDRRRIIRRVFFATFVLYLALLVNFTFLNGLFFRTQSTAGVNPVPFRSIRDVYIDSLRYGWINRSTVIMNLAGNLVLLAPMALFLPLFCKAFRRFWLFLPTIALCSALIEIGQYYSHRGCCDIDDVILNTIGAGLVFCVLRLPLIRKLVAWITFSKES